MYKGEKVRLRAYRKEDVKTCLEYLNDPEVKKLLTPGIPFPMTLQDEEKWYEKQSAFSELYNFAIETLEEGKYIGGCGINKLDWKNSNCTVGIFIGDKDYWGKGYGTDAMKVLVKFIFEEMNIHKIKLNVFSFNERAIKSYEKCGFKEEGRLRRELFKEGKYYDDIPMGILKEEYFENKI